MVAIGHCATSITTRGYTIARIAGLLLSPLHTMPAMRRQAKSARCENGAWHPTQCRIIGRSYHKRRPARYLRTIGRKGGYLPDDWGWVAKVGGKAEYVGTFAKRVGKYAHKRDIKLDSDFLGEIGSLVAQYTAKQTAYEFDFTNSFDWEAGDYGDHGSCFWGCRSGARAMLESNSGRAIRFYKEGRGYARAWLAPYENGWVCFNGYGIDTITIAQVLATHLGQTYKRVRLENNGEESGTLWINGGVGYFIGEEDAVQYNEHIDLEWDDEDGANRCYNCGNEGDILINDSYYCEDCACELFSHCDHCGEWVDNDDITQVEDNYYCDHCRNRLCTQCHECNEWVMDGNTTDVDGDAVCNSCLENGEIPFCEHCGTYTREGSEIDNEWYCNDCAEDLPTCEKCGADTRN